jgi:hypothetical protein
MKIKFKCSGCGDVHDHHTDTYETLKHGFSCSHKAECTICGCKVDMLSEKTARKLNEEKN